jgi:serine/threonine protein kinase
MARSDFEKACGLLLECLDWCTAQNLAARVVECQLLLSDAYAANGRTSDAALYLDRARSYCVERNLQAQYEKTTVKAAALGISLLPVFERGRNVEADAWRDRQAYVILGRLGSGGQGTVYKAYDNVRNKTVAYKRIRAEDGNSKPLQQVMREVNALSQGAVDGVANVLACGTGADGEPYIVQEFIEGQTLRAKLGSLPKSSLVRICASVIDTLVQVHKCGIIHSDVKPENIVVKPDGKPVLVDFGIAIVQKFQFSGTGAGSRDYRPSHWATSLQPPVWLDYFAIGMVLLECMGGGLPKQRRAGIRDLFLTEVDLRRAIQDLESREGIVLTEAQRTILDLVSPMGWRRISKVPQPSAILLGMLSH